ncbi:uncharacterized protein LOC108902083 isoform X1 [Lates japonicus]
MKPVLKLSDLFRADYRSVLFVFSSPRFFLFLVAALLPCPGETSQNSVHEKIMASAGETVILPCNITVSGDIPTVEWSKEGLKPNIIFLYRDGCETFEMKNPIFQYRTNLIMNEVKNGNISLRISDVQLSDAGKYQCKIIQRKDHKVIATLELIVGAVSEPKLSVVSCVDDKVTVQCEANCWSPESEIQFFDDQGINISTEDQKRDQDSSECFTVTRRVTVQTSIKRVTCRVHLPQINSTRETKIDIPAECTSSCTVTTAIASMGTLFLGSACVLACVFLCKKHGSCVGRKQLPESDQDQGTTRRNSEGNHLRNQAGDSENATTEHLRKIKELESNLCDRDKIIHGLNEEVNVLRSKLSPVVCQLSQPTIDKSPSKSSPEILNPFDLHPHGNNTNPTTSSNISCPKSDSLAQSKYSKPNFSRQNPALGSPIKRSSHNHSSPALLTNKELSSSPSPSASEEKHLVRSMSLSESQSRPKGAKPQRRFTISALAQNCRSTLEDLPEDSEPLIVLNRD